MYLPPAFVCPREHRRVEWQDLRRLFSGRTITHSLNATIRSVARPSTNVQVLLQGCEAVESDEETGGEISREQVEWQVCVSINIFISPAKLMCLRARVHHLHRGLPLLKTGLQNNHSAGSFSPPNLLLFSSSTRCALLQPEP